MEYTVLGWPPDGPTLRLDFRTFAYAGKFVMSNTGKAVVRATGPDERPPDGETVRSDQAESVTDAVDPELFARDIIAATAFNEDRTASDTAWIRYITVHVERRGSGVGGALANFTAEQIEQHGYTVIRIAVNNPFAYEALYKAGFGYTGQETGLAELVLQRPTPDGRSRYQEGLDVFRARDLSAAEMSFLESRHDARPPTEMTGVTDRDNRKGD